MKSHRRLISPENPVNFLKIILSDETSSTGIRLPEKFTDEYGKYLQEKVTLKVRNGDVWHVGLHKSKDEIWLKRGWGRVVEHYGLGFSNLLTFEFEGSSTFGLIIFDATASEIKYPKNTDRLKKSCDDSKIKTLDDDTSSSSSEQDQEHEIKINASGKHEADFNLSEINNLICKKASSKGNKSAKKSAFRFNLDDVDDLVRSFSKKVRKETGPSSSKPAYPHLKTSAKRKRTADMETETPSLKKRLLELIGEIPEFEHQMADYERQLAESKEAISVRDKMIKDLQKKNGEAAANLALVKAKHEELTQVVDEVKREAAKTVLTSRLKMAKEAEDAAFNRSKWDVVGWQKALDELDEGQEDADDLALVEVDGAEGVKDAGGRK